MAQTRVQWCFADSRFLGSQRLAVARWGCSKDLDTACMELARCGPESRGRPVRLRLSGGPHGRREEVGLGSVKEAMLHLRRLAQDGGGQPPPEANSPSSSSPPPFRCEDRSKIPDELLVGPFEKFSITEDVYSTAYLVARNATDDMYSIWPWKNPQVRIVWLYLFFIVGSQLFVMTVITLCYPTVVDKEVLYVDCANATSLASLLERGALEVAEPEACQEAGRLAFWADLHGAPVAYHVVEVDIPFFDAVLTDGSAIVYLLRLICCSWVFSQMYFQHFESVRSLIGYHDFSQWFIPLKGMEVRNNWAIGIAFVQYGVVLVVTTVSFVIVFAQKDPFDIVMNSLAFTFIAEVGSYFNAPLVKRLGSLRIEGLPKDYGDINYLYPEYLESNAIREDGTYTDEGWYILEEEEKAGLLSDYEVRHNPDAYPRSERLAQAMSWALALVPVLVTLLVAARARGGLPGLLGAAAPQGAASEL